MEKELTGKDLGGWTLAECIGFGKSALVFRATRAGVAGAAKVFDRELVERFGRAAQRERVESHPNLIGILDAGEDVDSDLFYVVMELFAGKNLAQSLDEIPQARVGALIAQVASAAEFLETLGLAHRDIKPENILLTMVNLYLTQGNTVKICDFGWSIYNPNKEMRLTLCGTPLYLAPEMVAQISYD